MSAAVASDVQYLLDEIAAARAAGDVEEVRRIRMTLFVTRGIRTTTYGELIP